MVDSAKLCIVCELEAQPKVCHQHTQTALITWIRTQPFVRQRSFGLRHPSPQSPIANKPWPTSQLPRRRLLVALLAMNQAQSKTEAVLRFSCVIKMQTDKEKGISTATLVSPRGLRAGRAGSSQLIPLKLQIKLLLPYSSSGRSSEIDLSGLWSMAHQP